VRPADALIAELEAATEGVRGFPDFRFSEMAREDLAAFRENRRNEQSHRNWSMPETYREKEEEFVVFSAFVHAYLSPILTARGILKLFPKVGDSEYTHIQFSRFGDTASFDMPASREWLPKFPEHEAEMVEALIQIGIDIFGDTFRAADFWGSEEARP